VAEERGQATLERAGWMREDPLLSVEDLHCAFRTASGRVHAVRGISFDVRRGETLGLVGESGCGKTTTGRAVLRLPPGERGRVRFRGEDMAKWSASQLRRARADIQMVFQDPISAFNPRRKAIDIVGEGLDIQGVPRQERTVLVQRALERVGLTAQQVGDRYPHEFSGGQNQRLAIARALALEPALLVCDEPVASLDVSVQARVLNVLQDIRESGDLSMIFISHDLSVVKIVSDRVAVMYRGKIVEIGDADAVYRDPVHPYTQRLIEAVPLLDDSDRVDFTPNTDLGETWRTTDFELVEVGPGHYAAVGDEVTQG